MLISGYIGYWFRKIGEKDTAGEIALARQKQLMEIAPLVVIELKEVLQLCVEWRVDWNTFFKSTVLVKKFPQIFLNMDNEILEEWSFEHDGQLHEISKLISDANYYLEKTEGRRRHSAEVSRRVDPLEKKIRELPDPFRVSLNG